MASFMKNVVLLTLLFLLSMTMSSDGLDLGRNRRHITISNGLDKALTVHCKSGDDDIGAKTLPISGVYEFGFIPRFLPKTTLYFCSFQWEGNFHYYDVYTEGIDCSECKYSVRALGRVSFICRYNYGTEKDDCFEWNK
ncbi:putative plant self-incompatibility S1 [Rosa chinensis]|uniref:S-protein homolog n=1 Tax=Rosa chinensis TaxID=74649 RepID=A0A2P6QSM1_ROSCH|nr:putative plant self-incompatibility S1 [Rosa chinensis]